MPAKAPHDQGGGSGRCQSHPTCRKACYTCKACTKCPPLSHCKSRVQHEAHPCQIGRTLRSAGVDDIDTRPAPAPRKRGRTTEVNTFPPGGMVPTPSSPAAKPIYPLERRAKSVAEESMSNYYYGDARFGVEEQAVLSQGDTADACARRAGLDAALEEIRKGGYSLQELAIGHTHARAMTAYRAFMQVLCANHDHQAVLHALLPSLDRDKLLSNVVKLAVGGDSLVRKVGEALLCASFPRVEVGAILGPAKRALETEDEGPVTSHLEPSTEAPPVPADALLDPLHTDFIAQPCCPSESHNPIGRRRYRTLCDVYRAIAQGKGFGVSPYSYRVPQAQLESAIAYLRGRLQAMPARSRPVHLDDGTFLGNLPVLARGSSTVLGLFLQYQDGMMDGPHLGERTFRQLHKVMTSASKSLSGLSSYYVEFRHVVATVGDMLTHAGAVGGDLARAAKLRLRLETHSQWLKYDYGHAHLTTGLCDGVAAHCPRRALGSVCDVAHSWLCTACEEASSVVAEISCYLRSTLGEEEDNAVLYLQQQFQRYSAHKLRERWQTGHLNALRRSLVHDGQHLLLVIDHKQKILPVSFRESQAAYFGKKGGVRVASGGKGMGHVGGVAFLV
jgi:hypothetical protein